MDLNPWERRQKILEVLCLRRHDTYGNLAHEFNVSTGTIRRDIVVRRKVNMLIDIQAKLAAGKGAGYERWAKIFNLKEAAKTLNFLVENDLTDYDELAARAEQAGDRFDEVSRHIKQLEGRMAEVAQLMLRIHKTVCGVVAFPEVPCAITQDLRS